MKYAANSKDSRRSVVKTCTRRGEVAVINVELRAYRAPPRSLIIPLSAAYRLYALRLSIGENLWLFLFLK